MDNVGHAARIAKIRQQHQWESPHVKERQTWKNMDYLLNRVDELEREVSDERRRTAEQISDKHRILGEYETAVQVAREARDTAEHRAKESVQAEMAELRAENQRLRRERLNDLKTIRSYKGGDRFDDGRDFAAIHAFVKGRIEQLTEEETADAQ